MNVQVNMVDIHNWCGPIATVLPPRLYVVKRTGSLILRPDLDVWWVLIVVGGVSVSLLIGEIDCESSGVSMYAGFSRSIDTLVSLPLMLIVKCLSRLIFTSYGPSYGVCRDGRTVSLRTNTCDESFSCLNTNGRVESWFAVCVGRVSRIASVNCLAKSDCGWNLLLSTRNSPGRRSVVPYTNCAAVVLMSSLDAERSPSKIIGNLFGQSFRPWHMMDDFRVRCQRSMSIWLYARFKSILLKTLLPCRMWVKSCSRHMGAIPLSAFAPCGEVMHTNSLTDDKFPIWSKIQIRSLPLWTCRVWVASVLQMVVGLSFQCNVWRLLLLVWVPLRWVEWCPWILPANRRTQ